MNKLSALMYPSHIHSKTCNATTIHSGTGEFQPSRFPPRVTRKFDLCVTVLPLITQIRADVRGALASLCEYTENIHPVVSYCLDTGNVILNFSITHPHISIQYLNGLFVWLPCGHCSCTTFPLSTYS